MKTIITILRMIKFSHTVFALPFAVWATFLGANGGKGGFCGWQKLLLIIWCMVWARSAAMTFNRLADAQSDAQNPRTADRALPTQKVRREQALGFFVVCGILFLTGTVLFYYPLGGFFGFGNIWPLVLSVPTLVFICFYSFAKRFTWLSHFWLGAALMLSPLGAWVAVCPPDGPLISLRICVLGAAVLLWTAGFDIIYACQDVAVDRRDGLFSIPANLGVDRALWISRCCHCLAIGMLLLMIKDRQLGWIYFAAVLAAAVLVAIEHVLVRGGEMRRINLAFETLNGIFSLLLAGAGITDIMLYI